MTWSAGRAEEHLLGLELFGMRFGLERMRRLLTALGSPQERFAAIHVGGTNGKSSTVRMAAALLEEHGVRAGAFLSPHLTSFAERIRIGDRDLEPDVRQHRDLGVDDVRGVPAPAQAGLDDRDLDAAARELVEGRGRDELELRDAVVGPQRAVDHLGRVARALDGRGEALG